MGALSRVAVAAPFLLALPALFLEADPEAEGDAARGRGRGRSRRVRLVFPLGLHFVIAAAVCWLIAGNLVAALLAAAVGGNP